MTGKKTSFGCTRYIYVWDDAANTPDHMSEHDVGTWQMLVCFERKW